MSTIILIGAGASFGSRGCTPHNPPLGNGLFDCLVKHNPQGIFATIEKDNPALGELFRNNFESGMEKFDQANRSQNGDYLREMSLFFLEFKPKKENLFIKLLSELKNRLAHTTFVTANYDLLIELSAVQLGINCRYIKQNHEQYFCNILKIHGSPNFIPKNLNATFSNVNFANCAVNIEAPITPTSIEEAKQFCLTEDSLAPAIAMYHPEKPVKYSKNFVMDQQKMWYAAIAEATTCIIIGLKISPGDKHIWKPISESSCKVFYLCHTHQDKQLANEWKQSIHKKNLYILDGSFESAFSNIKSWA